MPKLSLDERIDAAQVEIDAIRTEFETIQRKLTGKVSARRTLLRKRTQSRIENIGNMTDREVLRMFLDMSEDEMSPDHYNTRDLFFKGFGFRSSGRWLDTRQAALQFSIDSDATDQQLFELGENIQAVEPEIAADEETNSKRFDLTESTLSESGVYHLRKDAANAWKLTRASFGTRETLFEDADLMNVLKYVRRHHPR